MNIRAFQAIVLVLFAPFASAQTIDFETLPSGVATTDNMIISTQYEADFGVRFLLVDRDTGLPAGFPRIAKVGSPLTAFVSCGGDDTPDSGLGVGSSFLTDDGALGSSANLRIEYLTPTRDVSGVILDVDARSAEPGAVERWRVDAINTSGQIVGIATIVAPQGPDEPGCEGFNGEGDGSVRGFTFSRAANDIAAIELVYTGDAKLGSVGLAFDNFSPATPVDPLEADLTFTSFDVPNCEGSEIRLDVTTTGGFPDQTIRYESRESETDPWQELNVIDAEGGFHPKNGEEVRVVVSDGTTEVVTDPLRFDQEAHRVTVVAGDAVLENAALFLFEDQEAEEVWGGDPTTFDNEAIETEPETVHVVPMLTANGAHLSIIFNSTGGTTPGTVTTEINTVDWEPTFIFRDDPDKPPYNDTYTVEDLGPGIRRFTLVQTWAGDKTDGFIVGPLDPSGSCTITFTDSSGLSTGRFYRGDGEPLPFSFSEGMELMFENSCLQECEADLDGSDALDFGDVSLFLTLFAQSDAGVDFDASGSLDFGDVSEFLSLFAAGCP